MNLASTRPHLVNLTNLLWIRSECQADPGRAQGLFALDWAAADFYGGLNDVSIDALSAELDVAVIVPRFNRQSLSAALTEAAVCRPLSSRSPLELHNLRNLCTLREVCERSCSDAVMTYCITLETAEAFRCLNHAAMALLSRMLTVSAFVPRHSPAVLVKLLDMPAGARASFAAAWEPEIDQTKAWAPDIASHALIAGAL